VLLIVQPETVLRWHREGWRCRAQKLHPYPAGPLCRKPSSIRRLWPFEDLGRELAAVLAGYGPLDAL
jgi:hypothetical protein